MAFSNTTYCNKYVPKPIRLGSGAFGTVWKCGSPANETFYNEHPIVAVKRIEHTNSNAKDEAELLMQLNQKITLKTMPIRW